MKREKTIKRRIDNLNAIIKKFRAAKDLDKRMKKSAIFSIQFSIRQLKWTLK